MIEMTAMGTPKDWADARRRCTEMAAWDPPLRAEARAALDFFRENFETKMPWGGWEVCTRPDAPRRAPCAGVRAAAASGLAA
jgi:hypothetical protein